MFDSYAEIFSRRAAEYHSAMTRSPRARDAEFLAAVEPLRGLPPGLVCDIPAGGGYLADYLWPGMRYLGIEPAKDFLDASPRSIEQLNADIRNVPLADGTVDYIVSLAGLHHEPDLGAVFGEMRRLLRPGGRLVIADVAVDTPPARFLNGFVDRHNPLGHVGKFLDEGTVGSLLGAGFAVDSDSVVAVPWTFASDEEAGEFGRHLFGVTGLDAATVARALDEEIGVDQADGRLRLSWTLRRIVADAV